jgi:hypothetical protein
VRRTARNLDLSSLLNQPCASYKNIASSNSFIQRLSTQSIPHASARMSFLKKPLRKLTGSLRADKPNDLQDKEEGFATPTKNGSPKNGSLLGKIGNGTPSGASTPPDDKRKSREVMREEKDRRSMDKERSKVEARKRQSMRRIESEAFMRDAPPELTKLYKPYSMNMSKRWNHENRVLFKDLDFASKLRLAPPERHALRRSLRTGY